MLDTSSQCQSLTVLRLDGDGSTQKACGLSGGSAWFVPYLLSEHRCWLDPIYRYHLDKLVDLFPGLVFVHVLRDPRDMASVPWEHAKNRALAFSSLHGGYEKASEWFHESCSRALNTGEGCVISSAALAAVDKCKYGSSSGTAECAKAAGSPKKRVEYVLGSKYLDSLLPFPVEV